MRYHAVAFADDLIADCAKTVINDFSDKLPDIRAAIILLPEGVAKVYPQVTELQQKLLDCAKDKGIDALLTPTIATPQQLFLRRVALDASETHKRQEQLILAHSLKSHPDLFPHQNVWQISQSLMELFEEINDLKETGHYDSSLLKQSLSKLDPEIWDDDTKKFLSLWKVWEELILDKDHSLREMERQSFMDNRLVREDEHIYLCGADYLPLHQVSWAKRLYGEGRLTVLTQGSSHPLLYPQPTCELAATICGAGDLPPSADKFSQFIDSVFSQSDGTSEAVPFAQRARTFAQKVAHSPLQDRLCVFAANAFEEHAWGIYLTVKQWIEDGAHPKIGIVCLDRKLARRIRAIFDRYGLTLQDCSGWEISTTSSASAIFKLLPNEVEPFGVDTLIMLLRSPYCEFEVGYEQRLTMVCEIERCVARLDQMPQSIDELLKVLAHKDSTALKTQQIAQTIAAALDALQTMADTSAEHPLSEYFDTLSEVMQALGMSKRLSMDNAGKKLLSEFNMMREVAQRENLGGDYHFWHSWLLHNLEKSRYLPHPAQHSILLMRPEQARLWKVDAMVFAGLDYKSLPSSDCGVMNENIRRELGLQTQEQQTAYEFLLFRSVLENSGKVLMTYAAQDKGKDMAASLWLEALQKFHQCAYDDDLVDSGLGMRAVHCQDRPIKCEISSKPSRQKMPAPVAPHGTWPAHISAQSYKTMLECPYRFFVRYCLNLRPQSRPGNHWTALQFGRHIHRALQALHSDMAHYPGPMDRPWTAENREYALELATQIVEAMFTSAARSQYVNTYWKRLALTIADIYVGWMISLVSRNGDVRVSSEVEEEQTLGQDLALYGKIDLWVEQGEDRYIVDYKTGALPTLKSIEQGEDIQLALYALLKEGVHNASYLSLKVGKYEREFKQRDINFAQEKYHHLAGQRLQDMHSDYQRGAKLTAWGDEKTCAYCEWHGICRRPAWEGLEEQQ